MMIDDDFKAQNPRFFMKAFDKIPLAAFSIEEMEELLAQPFDGYVISLREPTEHHKIWYEDIDIYEENCKGMLKLWFEDVECQRYDEQKIPEKEDVQTILDWTRDIDLKKHRLAVHCTAGISRSSATAYIVACSKMPVKEALGCIDPLWHNPNMRIVGFGADILGDSKIYNELRRYLKINE
jgi:predicted protein tyrosine phosphatase